MMNTPSVWRDSPSSRAVKITIPSWLHPNSSSTEQPQDSSPICSDVPSLGSGLPKEGTALPKFARVVPKLPHTLCSLWAHSKHVLQRELENALIAAVQAAADAAYVLLNSSESARVEGRYGKPGIQAVWKVEHFSA